MELQSRPTVLLIDFDPDILKLMEYVFEGEDLELITCRTPEEGLRILSARRVGCLLLDVHFAHTPECFGLLDALRALPDGPNLPVLVTSAMQEVEISRRVLALGARKFIPKPFYPGEILDEIREALVVH
ncbi:MAG: response regulator [Deltaproteobacteria bacterium]|nr:response regulator [Deltaproteobacteria bacterium]